MRADEGVVRYLLEVEYSQQLVEVCRRHSTPPDPIVRLELSSDSPPTLRVGGTPTTRRARLVVRLNVVLPDPMHVDQIRGAYCAGWSARDDDHQIAALVAAQFQQRVIDLTNHA